MKTLVRSILLTGALAIGTNGLITAQGSDQWYKAKSGRSSPMEEARQRAERENTAFREETTREVAAPAFVLADHGGLLSKQQLKTLIANARTAQDHECLARHFNVKADQLEAEAKEHQELANQYKANPSMHETKHPMSGQTAGHCQTFADDLNKAAHRARHLAADHLDMAKQGPK